MTRRVLIGVVTVVVFGLATTSRAQTQSPWPERGSDSLQSTWSTEPRAR